MITGLFLITIILISGTFAFQQLYQGAFNPAWGDRTLVNGGRVHDDFEDREGPGAYDKDIFAENFGETDLFVRIQLREFLSIDDISIGDAAIYDPLSWPLYQAERDDVRLRRAATYTYDIGTHGIEWTLGNADDVQKIFMPTHNHVTGPVMGITPAVPAPFNDPDAYRFSNTTGRGVDSIAGSRSGGGGGRIAGQMSAEMIHQNGIQTGPSISDGTHDFWSLGSHWDAYLFYIDEYGQLARTAEYVRHYARETLQADHGGIMTLVEWRQLYDYLGMRPEGNFWIMDTENDGSWFYWNGHLEPAVMTQDGLEGGATSLLLNGIYIPDRPEAWQYVIHINADFFTEDSIDDLPDISYDAREIFTWSYVGPYPINDYETFLD